MEKYYHRADLSFIDEVESKLEDEQTRQGESMIDTNATTPQGAGKQSKASNLQSQNLI